MPYSHGSKVRLTSYDLPRFGGDTLFDRIARVVCTAGCLPRKELYEAWEVARRVRRHCRGGRVVDVAGGHGLLAHVLLLLDDTSPDARVVDPALPPSHLLLHRAIVEAWPRLDGRVTFVPADLGSVPIAADCLVVSSHACGALTDAVLARAVGARAPVAVLPCCHDARVSDGGPLRGWMDDALAIDAVRAVALDRAGYRVWTSVIPAEVTPKNRLIVAVPAAAR